MTWASRRASANLVRSLGGSVGVAVFGAIFAGRLDRRPGQVAGLDPAAIADALQPVFLVAAPFALAGCRWWCYCSTR